MSGFRSSSTEKPSLRGIVASSSSLRPAHFLELSSCLRWHVLVKGHQVVSPARYLRELQLALKVDYPIPSSKVWPDVVRAKNAVHVVVLP
jgi:hypothetical protein